MLVPTAAREAPEVLSQAGGMGSAERQPPARLPGLPREARN